MTIFSANRTATSEYPKSVFLMNNSHTNYQTSFKIAAGDGTGRFFEMIQLVFDWVRGKEVDSDFKKDWTNFCHKCEWKNLRNTGSNVITKSFLGDGRRAWALRLTECPRKTKGAWWYSNIGLKLEADEITIHVRISYSWPSEDFRTEKPEIRPSVPNVILSIFKHAAKNSWAIYSERPEFELSLEPWAITGAGGGRLLAKWIVATERKYPLIVFNGRLLTTEARDVARLLLGKSVVAVIDDDAGLAAEIREELPPELAIHHGTLRVFFPMSGNRLHPFRHRWLDPKEDDYAESKKGMIEGLLRNHSLVERHSVGTLEDVSHLVNLSKLKAIQSKSGLTEADFQPFFDEIEKVSSERDEFRSEADQYASQVDELEKEAGFLKAKFAAAERLRESEVSAKFKMRRLPSNLVEIVNIHAEINASALLFTDGAMNSAREYDTCEVLNEAWEILSQMSETLFRLKFEENRNVDFEKEFLELTGYRYVKTEGAATKEDSKLAQKRKIHHNGKDYEIWPHIAHGNHGNKCLRIHFAYDEELKRIVVGFVGRHMDNATTRKIK